MSRGYRRPPPSPSNNNNKQGGLFCSVVAATGWDGDGRTDRLDASRRHTRTEEEGEIAKEECRPSHRRAQEGRCSKLRIRSFRSIANEAVGLVSGGAHPSDASPPWASPLRQPLSNNSNNKKFVAFRSRRHRLRQRPAFVVGKTGRWSRRRRGRAAEAGCGVRILRWELATRTRGDGEVPTFRSRRRQHLRQRPSFVVQHMTPTRVYVRGSLLTRTGVDGILRRGKEIGRAHV